MRSPHSSSFRVHVPIAVPRHRTATTGLAAGVMNIYNSFVIVDDVLYEQLDELSGPAVPGHFVKRTFFVNVHKKV